MRCGPGERLSPFTTIVLFNVRPPNGSRLSCGRNAVGCKGAEPPIEPAGEGTQVFPQERPPASSAC
jgi:hypothetical protein